MPEPFTVGGALRVEVRHMKRLTERYGGGKGKAVTLARLQEGGVLECSIRTHMANGCGYKHRRTTKNGFSKTAKDFANLVYRCGVQSMGKIVQCRCFTNAGRRGNVGKRL